MLLLIVLCGTIISICIGLRQTLGLYMRPMTLEAGVSAAAFGFSIALQNIVWGISQPFVGAIADRWGARPVVMLFSLIYAAGLVLMIYSGTLPAALELSGFLIGLGTAGCSFGVLIGTVSRATPPETRIQTVGLVSAAGSLGTFLIAPYGQGLIGGFGWQWALVGYAVLAASMLLLALPLREQPIAGNCLEQTKARGRGARSGRAPRLPVHDPRVLRLRLPARVPHHAPAGLPAGLRHRARRRAQPRSR